MAEDTPTASAPDAAEPSVERASAEPKTGATESAPEAPKENEAEKSNGSEEKPSDNATVSEEKKESAEASAEAPAEKPSASAEPTGAKESEEGAAAPAESEAAPAPEANGTPASAKKSGGSKRKSTGAPEHKSKLSRKKSQIRTTHLDATPGQYYLARLRSFPPWPSIICDEDILPQSLLSSRPVTARRPDGTYREDYADGGKRAHERTFPIMFFQTNEFAWIPNTDLSPIDPATCKEVSEKGKSKLLLSAYSVAAEGHDLQHFKTVLTDHQRAIEQEDEEREAQAAAKAAAKAEREAKKNKRKSMEIIDDEDVDMDDADEESKKPKSSKKRKKDAETEGDEKPAKTPKTGTKLKLTTPKTPASEKKTPASSKARQTASSKKANKANDNGEEDTPAASKEPEKQVNQEEAKARKEKEILFVRHKLQKGFISRDQPPKEEEMTTMSGYFTKLENYGDLEVSIIRATKINKVLKMIVKLSSIPRDEEFNFRRRAVDLLSKWKTVLDADTPVGLADDKDEKLQANGTKEDSVDTPIKGDTEGEKEEDSKESKQDTAEPQDEPMTDADATEKSQPPEPVKEESDKTAPKADAPEKASEEKETEEKTTDEKPAAEKAEEKTEEAAA